MPPGPPEDTLFSFTPSERRSFLLTTLPFIAYMVYALTRAFQTEAGFTTLLAWSGVWLGVSAYWFVRLAQRRRAAPHRVLALPAWTTLPAILTLTPPATTQPAFTSDKPSPRPQSFRLRPSPLRGPPVPVR